MLLHRSLLAVLTLAVALGGGLTVAWSCNRSAPRTQDEDVRGVFLRAAGEERFRFVPWESELALNRELVALAEGGEVRFAPGTYELRQAIHLHDARDLRISGSPGTVLAFADEPEVRPRVVAAVPDGSGTLRVDRPGDLHVGWKYQLYRPDGHGDRILEFRVARIEGEVVHLTRAARLMGHVEEIPVDSIVIEEINAFRIERCDRIVLEDLVIDGRGRGDVDGHTTYSGVYVTGRYEKGERPRAHGMELRGCTLRRLQGRGFMAYGVGDIHVEGCLVEDVLTQGLEIDHYSTGRIVGNVVRRCGVGIALNDCFDSLVEANVVRDCQTAIGFVKHFDEDWVNTGTVVRDNVLVGPGRAISFQKPMRGNVVRGNLLLGFDEQRRIVNGDGNVLEENVAR